MKIVQVGLTFTFFCLLNVNYATETIQNVNISDISDIKQSKRDLSYSYSAADIGSKEGTHIKTITVIKNILGKKDNSIKIDPQLHKDENWGSHFRDNFDSYGKIPEIPDIDDLINNKGNEKSMVVPTEQNITENSVITEKASVIREKNTSNNSSSKYELTSETVAESDIKEIVEKIPGDVELINTETANLQLKSQSLPQYSGQHYPLKRKYEDHSAPEGTQFLTQYSTPQHSVRQYFIQTDKKLNSKDGLKKSSKIIIQPCDRAYPLYPPHQQGYPSLTGITITNGDNNSGSVVKVTTPSGRTYDIPLPTTTSKPPYIAPSLKKTTNYNSSSDSNNNSNNINNNINIGQPSFNFNNILGTQPVNIPVNQPVNVPINNPPPSTPAPPGQNGTVFFPLNIPIGYQQNFQQPNLITGTPGVNPYNNPLNNPLFNPLLNKGYNLHTNVPNYGFINKTPYNIPFNQLGNQGNNQQGIQGLNQPGIQNLNPQVQNTNQQPINQDTSAVTFPNLSDSILNNNNLIVQQNFNNKQFIPPQNASVPGSFSVNNNNNLNNPAQSTYNRFIPTGNKINYAIPYTSLPKRSSNINQITKQKGRSRGLRY